MANDNESFPHDYDPQSEVNQLLSGEGNENGEYNGHPTDEVLEASTSEIVARNDVKSVIAHLYNQPGSDLDKDVLQTIEDEMDNRIRLAKNVRDFYAKIRDHEIHGSQIDLTESISSQVDAISLELNILRNTALDEHTKQALAEAIREIGGKVWD